MVTWGHLIRGGSSWSADFDGGILRAPFCAFVVPNEAGVSSSYQGTVSFFASPTLHNRIFLKKNPAKQSIGFVESKTLYSQRLYALGGWCVRYGWMGGRERV